MLKLQNKIIKFEKVLYVKISMKIIYISSYPFVKLLNFSWHEPKINM